MREVNYCQPLEEFPSSPVIYGVARGLEDLFPVVDHPRFQYDEDGADALSARPVDEADQGTHRVR
ncbi:hypothetical protein ACLBWX_14505 [Methylobacterium sp. M6A4_1b]